MNRANSDQKSNIYSLDISGEELKYVVEEDLRQLEELQTLNVSENELPFARLGVLTKLKKLMIACNGIQSLDLEVEDRFQELEYLDLSFNQITPATQIVLATLPRLEYLDLSNNNIQTISSSILNISKWKEKVLEFILPNDYQIQLPETASVISEPLQELPRIGFPALKTLNLENNDLGMDPNFWNILARLPCLTVLNLDNNGISVVNLVEQDPMDYINLEPIEAMRYEGFPSLEKLSLCNNQLKTIKDTLGILALNISSLNLIGNEVVQFLKKDAITLFSNYGIRLEISNAPEKKRFTSHYLKKNIKIQPKNQVMTHVVTDDQVEKDIQEMVSTKRIPQKYWEEDDLTESIDSFIPNVYLQNIAKDDYPLPTNIKDSVKALRHVMSNPKAYWRTMELSYGVSPPPETLPSETQSRPRSVSSLSRYSSPVNSIWTPNNGPNDWSFNNYQVPPEMEYKVEKTHEKQTTYDIPMSAGELNELVTDKLQRRRLPTLSLPPSTPMIKVKKREEFHVMQDIMATVDRKLNTITVSLNQGMQSVRKYLPESQRLLKELQSEYERIEAQCLKEAQEIVAMEQSLS